MKDKKMFDIGELERIACDEGITVPEGFGDEISGMIDGLDAAERIAASEKRPSEKFWKYSVGIAAGVALLLSIGLTTFRTPAPEDTFTDPALAYAEVEKALAKISSKMVAGMDRAELAGQEIGRQTVLLNNIYNGQRNLESVLK